MPTETEILYDKLCSVMRGYMPAIDESRLKQTYEFILLAHEGQKRKSGEPYAIHPLEVAIIIAEMGLDQDSVTAALLHDVVEDTDYAFEDIKKLFGKPVAELVDGVTKLTRANFVSKEDEQMENLRKMFVAMANDIRVILIKIADRLHNMRTLEYQSEQKRREKSRETLEIYAPLSHRLGMQRIKWELEDLGLKNLDPVGYEEIMRELDERLINPNGLIKTLREAIDSRLREQNITARIEGRVKHIYSIYRKMYGQHKALFEIYDLYAIRVIVDIQPDCYNVLGMIHAEFKLIPGRFKDYISTPKPNGYQSLHTTVIGRDGIPFEVQIRTEEMHETAEYGIAAHWKYKQKEQVPGVSLDESLTWVRRLLESQQDSDAEEFISALKSDMFSDEVFVYTPKGDIISFPLGATPIDYAYAIHSAVGNRMMGAKVFGRIVKFDYQLQNGDVVEIITSASHRPSRGWLQLVKTSEARNKIKQWFKRECREENVEHGKQALDSEIKRAGLSLAITDEIIAIVLKRMSFSTMDDLCAAIGYGGITTTRTINRIRDELVRVNKLTPPKVVEKPKNIIKKPRPLVSGIRVQGMDNCLYKIARCCLPAPGDPIVGFVTRGFGVSIHRQDCPNAIPDEEFEDADRWLWAEWTDGESGTFASALSISATDRQTLLTEILNIFNVAHVSVPSVESKTLSDGTAFINLRMEIKSRAELDAMISRVSRVAGVRNVTRRSGDEKSDR